MQMPRIVSPPVKLHWAGWESDTLRLQQNGWEISAHQDFNRDAMQLALQHRQLDVRGLTSMFSFDYHRYHSGRSGSYDWKGMMRDLIVQVMAFTPRFEIRTTYFPKPWVAVDATPSIVSHEIHSLNDLALFQPLPSPDKDIIIEPPSFDEILKMALEHQAPKQKELREKARQRMGAILRIAA